MKKTIDQLLQEGLQEIENGTFQVEIDPGEIVIHDPENLEKRLSELLRLNGISKQKGNFPDELREEIRRMKAGESVIEKCTGREALEMESKKRNVVEIRVSKSTYSQLAKKAKRAKMDVPEFLKKLAGEK